MVSRGNLRNSIDEWTHFPATRLNNLFYQGSHVIIIVTYIMFLIITVRRIPDHDGWILTAWMFKAGIGIIFFIPIIIKIMNYYDSWLQRLVMSAHCLFFYYIGVDFGFSRLLHLLYGLFPNTPVSFMLVLLLIIVLEYILFRPSIQIATRSELRLEQDRYWDLGLRKRVLLTTVSSVSLLVFFFTYVAHKANAVWAQDLESLQVWIVRLLALIIFVFIWRTRVKTPAARRYLAMSAIIVFLVLFGIIPVDLNSSESRQFASLIGPVGLFLLVFTYDGTLYFSRIRAQWRHAMSPVRHDRIRAQMAPIFPPVNLVDRIVRAFTTRVSNISPLGVVVFLFLLAFIGGVCTISGVNGVSRKE